MGKYLLHNHDVALVLNRYYKLVSSQFHVRYYPLLTTTKEFDSLSLWQARAIFVLRSGYTLSCGNRAANREALSTHPSPQEGGKCAFLDTSAPGLHYQPEGYSGRHYQQEGDPDANFSPQEGSSSDENTSQPGGASQPDARLSQQEGSSNDDIPSQQ